VERIHAAVNAGGHVWRDIAALLNESAAELTRLRAFATDVAENYDHELDAHRYNNGACRKCNAEAALLPPSPETPNP
jgi:sigma54-dependent transcription regulator